MNTQTSKQRKILNISLPFNLYCDVERSAQAEDKTKAELAREALREYIEDRRRWRQIRKWGKETARKFNIKNEDDIERIVDEIRCQE